MNDSGLPRERWERMARRLRRTLRSAGLDREGEHRVLADFGRAMEVRHRRLPSEDDPPYLHPGRVVLILLGDQDEGDPDVLAAGALAETRDLELRAEGAPELPQPAWWTAPFPVGAFPLPDEELLEALVTGPGEIQRLALAEALDQLRHAHLWEEPSDAGRAAALAEGVFLPLAGRVHPVLERRFSWWVRRVGSRLGP